MARPYPEEEDDVLNSVMAAQEDGDGVAVEVSEEEQPIMSPPGPVDEEGESDAEKSDPGRVLDEAIAKLEELRGLVASV